MNLNKIGISLFLIAIFSLSCFAQKAYKKKYADLLEPNAKLFSSGFNYTIERINSQTYILKRYYPETRQITYLATFYSNRLEVKHGPYEDRFDDGTIVNKGMYANNIKEGDWIENINDQGIYKNGIKEGLWRIADSKKHNIGEYQYINGERHGKAITFDSMGIVTSETTYSHGKIVSTTLDTTLVETMPRFPGCEDSNGTVEEKLSCSTRKLLEYVYGNLNYPSAARMQGVQGQALIEFVIDKDGRVIDIKPLRGVSSEIKTVCVNLVENMPRWIPGTQGGVPVKVLFTLPVSFKLE